MRAILLASLLGAASLSAGAPALAAALDPATAEADVTRARADGEDAFCKSPERPLTRRARALCPIASDVKGCQGFVDACNADEALKGQKEPPKPEEKHPLKLSEALAHFFAAIAQIAIWLLVAAVIVAIAIPVIQAIAKARRDKKVAEPVPEIAPAPALAQEAAELESISDAELLLRRGEEQMQRGELDRATVTFLSAALRALDQRGAIRIARHRTNGEYVRGCKDPEAKRPLREIVREVDKVQFGGQKPTHDTARSVASRAAALVRTLPIALLAIFVLGACEPRERGPLLRNADPAGDELMMDLLKRQGMTVARLGGSLATLPMPKPDAPAPAVVVDVERTTLEDETREHLARWVEAGGVLVLAGNPSEWPTQLEAKAKAGVSTDVTVAIPEEPAEDDETNETTEQTHFEHAKIARPLALAWDKKTNELATLKSGEMYAASRPHGAGMVLGIANDDLFTNAGLAHAGNAAALVALLSVVDRAHDFKIARPEDGISPPTNPISALHRAGLGLGLWHALAAALVLFLAVGIRQARPKPTPPPTRRAFTEHVEATGALYARTRIASHALAAYVKYADERLRTKMPRGTSDPATFLASRSGTDPAHCAAIWARAIAVRSGDPPRGDELAVLKELSALYTSATKSE